MPKRMLAGIFSADKRVVLPALADSVAVAICSLPLWAAWLATSKEHSLGELMPPSLLTIATVIAYVVLAFITSLLAIRATQRAATDKVRTRRSWLRTSVAITLALIFPSVLGTTLNTDFSWSAAWQFLASTGFIGVPTALRLTAPKKMALPPQPTILRRLDRPEDYS